MLRANETGRLAEHSAGSPGGRKKKGTALPRAWKGDSREFLAHWVTAHDFVLGKLIQVPNFEFNKIIWARSKNVPDPFYVEKENKTEQKKDFSTGKLVLDNEGKPVMEYKTVRIITEVFPNKEAAEKAAGEGETSNNRALELSATAKEGGVTVEHLKGYADYITRERRKKVADKAIAGELLVEVSDLPLAFDKVPISDDEAPF